MAAPDFSGMKAEGSFDLSAASSAYGGRIGNTSVGGLNFSVSPFGTSQHAAIAIVAVAVVAALLLIKRGKK